MASTRNKNSKEDYCLEKNKSSRFTEHQNYKYSRHNYDPKLPGFGYMPTHIPASDLTYNYVNVESQLFGIGANDLEKPRIMEQPDSKHMKELTLIQQTPVLMPRPITIEKNQRHLWPFS